MTEIWKDITDYEGLYQVSSEGRVKRLAYHQIMPRNGKDVLFEERILKQRQSKKRLYKQITVSLSNKSKRTTKTVARLVALAFVENPDNKSEVHHIDHNPENNNADNLAWVSRKEQFDEHWSNEMTKSKKGKQPLNAKSVIVDGITFKSTNKASIYFGWNKDAIASAKYRGRTSVKGKEFIVVN